MAHLQGIGKLVCDCCGSLCNCCLQCCKKTCSKLFSCIKCADFCPCLQKFDSRKTFCPCLPASGGVCSCFPCLTWLWPALGDQQKIEDLEAADYIKELKKQKRPTIRLDTAGKEALRKLGSFFIGLLITAIYAGIVLFVRNYNLSFCLITTIVLAYFLSLGMAFSMRVRINVLLMLPQLFSQESKVIIFLFAASLVVQGPTSNIVQNIKRSMQTMACGAQVAINKTRTLMTKITQPIVTAVKTMKKVEKKVKESSSGTRRLLNKIMDKVKKAVTGLRAALSFLTNIGGHCNTEMERPYKKCTKAFDSAKKNCFKVMSFMGFLCYILDVFRPLCGVAKIITVICLIPHFMEGLFRKYLKIPLAKVLQSFKNRFNFKVGGSEGQKHRAKVTDIAAGILQELKGYWNTIKVVLGMLSNSMLVFCIFNYIKAVQYRRNYMKDNNHDNNFITHDFILLDAMRVEQNREALIPLSSYESYTLVRPTAIKLTKYEKTGYMFALMNVFRSSLFAAIVIGLDYLFYYILSLVSYLMSGEVIAEPPFAMSMVIQGSGYSDEIYKGLASAYETMQKKNVSSVYKSCQIHPSEPDYLQYVLIGLMHGLVAFIAAFGVYIQRLKRYICACYYPAREKIRICFLYNQLLTKRLHLEKSLFQSIRNNKGDQGHTNILLILAAQCPSLFSWLANFVGANQEYCLACARVRTSDNNTDFHRCVTPGCKGLYCAQCSKILKECCTLCKGPLIDFSLDEELDSSDDETFNVWLEGMKTLKTDKNAKRKMRKTIRSRLKENFKKRGSCSVLIQKYKDSKTESDTDDSSDLSDMDSGDERDSDSEYQYVKGHDDIFSSWPKPPKTGQKKADLIPLPRIQEKTNIKGRGRRRKKDLERGP